jgi:hypothetical protein
VEDLPTAVQQPRVDLGDAGDGRPGPAVPELQVGPGHVPEAGAGPGGQQQAAGGLPGHRPSPACRPGGGGEGEGREVEPEQEEAVVGVQEAVGEPTEGGEQGGGRGLRLLLGGLCCLGPRLLRGVPLAVGHRGSLLILFLFHRVIIFLHVLESYLLRFICVFVPQGRATCD